MIINWWKLHWWQSMKFHMKTEDVFCSGYNLCLCFRFSFMTSYRKCSIINTYVVFIYYHLYNDYLKKGINVKEDTTHQTDLGFHMHIMTSTHTHSHTNNNCVNNTYTFINTESITNKMTSFITSISLNYMESKHWYFCRTLTAHEPIRASAENAPPTGAIWLIDTGCVQLKYFD